MKAPWQVSRSSQKLQPSVLAGHQPTECCPQIARHMASASHIDGQLLRHCPHGELDIDEDAWAGIAAWVAASTMMAASLSSVLLISSPLVSVCAAIETRPTIGQAGGGLSTFSSYALTTN